GAHGFNGFVIGSGQRPIRPAHQPINQRRQGRGSETGPQALWTSRVEEGMVSSVEGSIPASAEQGQQLADRHFLRPEQAQQPAPELIVLVVGRQIGQQGTERAALGGAGQRVEGFQRFRAQTGKKSSIQRLLEQQRHQRADPAAGGYLVGQPLGFDRGTRLTQHLFQLSSQAGVGQAAQIGFGTLWVKMPGGSQLQHALGEVGPLCICNGHYVGPDGGQRVQLNK
nr:hypothetical protein [Tanacetum cinerariifolium]